MDDESDFDLEAWSETEWDSVERAEIHFDADGSADLFLLVDGELIDYGTLSPDEVEQYIWDDLYWWAEDNDIEIDKETMYG